jgi:WhiB family redox-sensing transcriptional regulator
MSARVIEVMAWHPQVPGTDRHVARISASRPGASPAPDLALVSPDEWDWQDRALCAETDPAAFFPELGVNDVTPALRVCFACEVRSKCLEWAIANREEGIWGGTTDDERTRMSIPDRERNGLAALSVAARKEKRK